MKPGRRIRSGAVIDREKYNDLCEEMRQRAGATGCVIIVFHGERGSGISCRVQVELANELPPLLRKIGDPMEVDNQDLGSLN